MSKHTPGPWRLAPRAYLCVIGGPDGRMVANAGTGSRTFAVEELEEEQTANACLIAEAPTMHQLLKRASHALRSSAGPEEIQNVQREIHELLARVAEQGAA